MKSWLHSASTVGVAVFAASAAVTTAAASAALLGFSTFGAAMAMAWGNPWWVAAVAVLRVTDELDAAK